MALSRRQVQRKFPPGTMVTDGQNLRMVVGYAPTSPRGESNGRTVPTSWEVLLLSQGQLVIWHWSDLDERFCNIEGWE